ncbi:MAG: DUF2461 domain-containing protein [Clostridiales bacterium]|nr:DUF2461 domain-containing protein [Clostridiales bacterium]
MPITPKSLDFLFENRIRNSKQWYDDHKDDYIKYVRQPLEELVIWLTPAMMDIDERMICEPKVGKSIARIRRDTRFSKDKSLYRDHIWISFMREKKLYNGLPAFFFEISPGGFSYGCGYYQASSESMTNMRELILSGDKDFKAALKAFKDQDVFELIGDTYKKDHYPDSSADARNWLNRKNICLFHDSKDFDLLFSDRLCDKLSHDFSLIGPVYKFMMKIYKE